MSTTHPHRADRAHAVYPSDPATIDKDRQFFSGLPGVGFTEQVPGEPGMSEVVYDPKQATKVREYLEGKGLSPSDDIFGGDIMQALCAMLGAETGTNQGRTA